MSTDPSITGSPRLRHRLAVVGVLGVVALLGLLLVMALRPSGPPIDGTRYADRLSIGGGDRSAVSVAVAPFDGVVTAEIDQQANPPVYLVVFPVDDIDELIDIADRIERTSTLEASLVPAPTGTPLP